MLGQLRLAWWRDRLNDDPAKWPKGEPLLGRLGSWGERSRALVPLVDGWEALLGEPLPVWKLIAAVLIISGLAINLLGPRFARSVQTS